MKVKALLIIVIVIVLCIGLTAIFTGDRFVFRALTKQIKQIEHKDYITKVSIEARMPWTYIHFFCNQKLSEEEMDKLSYELMENINKHIYVGMTEYIKNGLNPAQIILIIRPYEGVDKNNSRSFERNITREKETGVWHVRWWQTGGKSLFEGAELEVIIPYSHPFPDLLQPSN